jgi:hypothetical protein
LHILALQNRYADPQIVGTLAREENGLSKRSTDTYSKVLRLHF